MSHILQVRTWDLERSSHFPEDTQVKWESRIALDADSLTSDPMDHHTKIWWTPMYPSPMSATSENAAIFVLSLSLLRNKATMIVKGICEPLPNLSFLSYLKQTLAKFYICITLCVCVLYILLCKIYITMQNFYHIHLLYLLICIL